MILISNQKWLLMLLETPNQGTLGSFHICNLCRSVNLSQGFDFYVIKMFLVKVMRPPIAKKIHTHSGSLPGNFLNVGKSA